MAEAPLYGAFGDVENQDENTFGVYQLQTQTPDDVINLQKVYGTEALPVFQFVKAIQHK